MSRGFDDARSLVELLQALEEGVGYTRDGACRELGWTARFRFARALKIARELSYPIVALRCVGDGRGRVYRLASDHSQAMPFMSARTSYDSTSASTALGVIEGVIAKCGTNEVTEVLRLQLAATRATMRLLHERVEREPQPEPATAT